METLKRTDIKVLKNLQGDCQKMLLTSLMKIIASSSQFEAIKACQLLLTCIKKIEIINENFRPTPALLRTLNLQRLLGSSFDEPVYDIMVFILRYYPDVVYQDFGIDRSGQEKLKREEAFRAWNSIQHLNVRLNGFKSDVKERRVRTAIFLSNL